MGRLFVELLRLALVHVLLIGWAGLAALDAVNDTPGAQFVRDLEWFADTEAHDGDCVRRWGGAEEQEYWYVYTVAQFALAPALLVWDKGTPCDVYIAP